MELERELLKANRFLDALKTHVRFRDVLRDIEAEYRKLTDSMIWIGDGRLGDGPYISGFWIDRTKVSVKKYREYVDEVYDAELPFDWERQLKSPDRPVVGVAFGMAQAYARHVKKSLPSLDQRRLARQAPKLYERQNSSELRPEWVRPMNEKDEGLLVSDHDIVKESELTDVTRQERTRFRCILEAQSWDGR